MKGREGLLKENVWDGLDRAQQPHRKKNSQDHNAGAGKGTLQPWEVYLSQKRAHIFCVRSFLTPALAEEPAKSLGRCEHPCGMSCSKKHPKDVFVCFANSAAVVQRVYPTTANNQEVLEHQFVEVCKGSGLPWILGVFWVWGWFFLLSPLHVQFLDLMTGGDKQCFQHAFQVRLHLL